MGNMLRRWSASHIKQSDLSTKPSELPSHVHLFGHDDTQLLHLIVIQAKSSFNIFLNILSSSYVSRYYLQMTIFLYIYNLKYICFTTVSRPVMSPT
jgi:hypothetical protein